MVSSTNTYSGEELTCLCVLRFFRARGSSNSNASWTELALAWWTCFIGHVNVGVDVECTDVDAVECNMYKASDRVLSHDSACKSIKTKAPDGCSL